MIFLIEFSRRRGLQSFRTFDDSEIVKANEARATAISRNISQLDDVEIALFESVNENTLRATHRRYFENEAQMIGAIADGLQSTLPD
jgi:hypothetical protein